MPRILDIYLDAVIYLYRDRQAAELGVRFGGSGFLVAYPSERIDGLDFIYAITNSHVIREGCSPVVRVNDMHGKTDILPLEQKHWTHHADGDDVAVAPVDLSEAHHRFAAIPTQLFGTHERTANVDLGPGDECFMLGRFVTHDGKQRNLPTVRFGNLAMMPLEPIEHPTRGIQQESYLVDVRSIPGYSGSAVFAYRAAKMTADGQITPIISSGPLLLGVDWCHLNDKRSVLDEHGKKLSEYVKQNSGMMGVVPAWKILDVFQEEVLVKLRKKQEDAAAV